MWEEEPSYQAADFRRLVHVVRVATVVATVYALVFREWDIAVIWYTILGVLAGALCIYACFVWSGAHGVRLVVRLGRRFRKGGTDA